jgi:DNA-binding transcriptional LysR family regulator
MTLHQLRLFLAVSKHLSVTQASQELHISQPAVSRQLRQLEDACGGKLYTVGPRGIELTANGRLLLGGAEQILPC